MTAEQKAAQQKKDLAENEDKKIIEGVLLGMRALPDNATFWELFKAQIQADFAPILIIIPRPIKKLIASSSIKLAHRLKAVIGGPITPMIVVAGRILGIIGNSVVYIGEDVVKISQFLIDINFSPPVLEFIPQNSLVPSTDSQELQEIKNDEILSALHLSDDIEVEVVDVDIVSDVDLVSTEMDRNNYSESVVDISDAIIESAVTDQILDNDDIITENKESNILSETLNLGGGEQNSEKNSISSDFDKVDNSLENLDNGLSEENFEEENADVEYIEI